MTEPADSHTPPPPLAISRRHLVIGAVLGAASLTAQAREPVVKAKPIPTKTFSKWVPRKFNDWVATNGDGIILPPPDVLSDRQYDDLVSLNYFHPDGRVVMLCIAYNYRQDGVVQIHRPEICYNTGGFKMTAAQDLTLNVAGRPVPSKYFSATGPQRTEQILYWTRIGTQFPNDWVDQRLSVIASNIAGVIPDGVLVRFSVASTRPRESLSDLRAFIADFMAAADPRLRQVMLGSAGSV